MTDSKNEKLTTSGPYGFTRNPLYAGTFLLGLGVAVGAASVWFAALFVALYLVIYVSVMYAEAETMRALFADEYPQYSREVPLFVPRLTRYRATAFNSENNALSSSLIDPGRFDVSLYLLHREYRAAMGFLAVYGLLAAKLALV